MNTYETDEEKVEAIKKWWKENGFSVVAGVAIGLGAVLGWRQWGEYRDSVAQQASAAFEQLMAIADAGDGESALKQAELVADEYASTSYAALANLVRARVALEAGDSAGASAALEQTIAQAPDPGIARIAALRLARILIAEGDLAAAGGILEQYDDGGSFGGDFEALRGDIAAAEGRAGEARQAYQQALAGGAANPKLLQLKLDNLPPAG